MRMLPRGTGVREKRSKPVGLGRGVVGTVAALLLFPAALHAGTVEHPGVLPKNTECVSCHTSKITGTSVHSVMMTSCGVCHVTMTQGDMTLMSLSMPKEKICFACHEESAALRQHVPSVRGQCVECHDAHSSQRRMLLLQEMPGARLAAAKRK